MIKNIPVLVIFLLMSVSLFSEDIFLFSRASFINAQFWERQVAKDDSSESDRKVMSNYTGGSVGAGMEFVIWDLGKKRGSRLFFISGVDVAFLGLNYLGHIPDTLTYNPMKTVSIKGGASSVGVDFDFFLGGTFPRTDLKWGVGSNFYFMFSSYSSVALSESEKFSFFTTPSVFIAYDFFIKNTELKITPMLKTGITCVPMIPYDYFDNMNHYEASAAENWYSGIFVELSVSVAFKSFRWKK